MTRPPRPDPDADAPDWWRRSAGLRRVPLIAAIILVVILVRAGSNPSWPAITKSCTTPAFALSGTSVAPHHLLQWSATGPAHTRFALAVGVRGFRPTPSRLDPIPDPGVPRTAALTSALQEMGGSCIAHGQFSLLRPGSYTVRLFTLTGPDADPQVTAVASRPVRVTAT